LTKIGGDSGDRDGCAAGDQIAVDIAGIGLGRALRAQHTRGDEDKTSPHTLSLSESPMRFNTVNPLVRRSRLALRR